MHFVTKVVTWDEIYWRIDLYYWQGQEIVYTLKNIEELN